MSHLYTCNNMQRLNLEHLNLLQLPS